MGFAQIAQSYSQKCKIVAHVFQVLFIFVAGCITLAILTKGGYVGGGTKYFLALCLLSVPALLYLVMVPMWQRTVRFANVWAFISIDALYTILWLAAFISVAMYNSAGIRQGAKDANLDENDGNCTTFAYGSEGKCNISRATVGLGAVVFVLFLITTGISAYWAQHFHKTGESPFAGMAGGVGPNGRTQAPDFEAQKTDNADGAHEWSADMNDHGRTSDEYMLNTSTIDETHPGRPIDWSNVDDDTTYHSPAGAGVGTYRKPTAVDTTEYSGYQEPSALSPGGYEDYRRSDVPAHTADDRDESQGYNGYERYRDEQQRKQSQGGGYSFS
ncbi:hypothetical protein EJ05DRAFT_93498 [Pseudovirgaria hyperparasitica]|uniref:MARVEL domain-containing protein n=1 Tax=Pseudovirgaria hyperparasitica TaxID=470096 RepID=A0A6A6W2M5_9PEZI|nr:uncharacterized protein EJ05DRAFT_93498 [Pseudovirgaria hyperparasitica]KAF2756210.1 hypothetical protein EJ05DRAFT_93498 [Pseudovirgaria hyperparasitica]